MLAQISDEVAGPAEQGQERFSVTLRQLHWHAARQNAAVAANHDQSKPRTEQHLVFENPPGSGHRIIGCYSNHQLYAGVWHAPAGLLEQTTYDVVYQILNKKLSIRPVYQLPASLHHYCNPAHATRQWSIPVQPILL